MNLIELSHKLFKFRRKNIILKLLLRGKHKLDKDLDQHDNVTRAYDVVNSNYE